METLITGNLESVALIQAFTAIIAVLILVNAVKWAFGNSKSEQYRKAYADMYVVGRIKQLATKSNINIETEFKEFLKFSKKNRDYYKDLDEKIEADLKDRVDVDFDEEQEKKNKK